MPNLNPGPARTVHQPTVAVLTPVNNGPSPDSFPQGANAFRLLAHVNNLQLQAGDTCVPVINTTRFVPIMAVYANALLNGLDTATAPANVAAAQVGVFSTAGGAAAGTPPANQIVPSTVLAGLTTGAMWETVAAATTFPFAAATATGSVIIPAPQPQFGQNGAAIFVNVATAVVGGTVDFFLYGFDMSDMLALPAYQVTDMRGPFAFDSVAAALNAAPVVT